VQSASSNFTQEASGGNVAWAKPRVFADWDRTGYLAAGSIDDLSDQVGDSFTIVHTLDDGLPDDVSLSTSQTFVSLDLDLVYGRGNRASTYFSPYNGSSPVSGFDRDVAPVKLDWGLVTAGGQEYVRLFTGQMSNLRTRGQVVRMEAMSATRLKLASLIQPPAVSARLAGMNGSWPVSYALAQCGIYVSPAPRGGCRWWVPMHGSMWPMIPATTPPEQGTDPALVALNAGGSFANGDATNPRPTWVAGPYFLGLNVQLRTARQVRASVLTIDLGSGTDILSQAASAGRVEFWLRGDAADVNTAPAGSGTVAKLAGFVFKNAGTNTGQVTAGVGTDRKPFVTVADGTNTRTLTHTTVLPTDGAWHSVGAAYNVATGNLWVYLDGVQQTSSVVLTTANLPAAEKFDVFGGYPRFESYLPVAEVHVTAGADAAPGSVPWLPMSRSRRRWSSASRSWSSKR
jgi:hypothetical protein